MEWKDIKTAPKDGTAILLGGGTWMDDKWPKHKCIRVGWWEDDFWNTCSAEAGYSRFPYNNPKYWMSLDDLPKFPLKKNCLR